MPIPGSGIWLGGGGAWVGWVPLRSRVGFPLLSFSVPGASRSPSLGAKLWQNPGATGRASLGEYHCKRYCAAWRKNSVGREQTS